MSPQRTTAERALRVLPLPLAEAPERVLVNLACVLIGIAGFTSRPGSLLDRWPGWVAYEWAGLMVVGGTMALVGYWTDRLTVERTGYIAIGACCTFYGIGLLVVFGFDGVYSAILYFAIACSKGIRLLVTSAARDALKRARLSREDNGS